MSNYLSIATVTATLAHVLEKAARQAVPGATVTSLRPESVVNGTPEPKINIYLYQISPNPAQRNLDLPTRTSNGRLQNYPLAAMDLNYIITFYGDESALQPQRLLGSTVTLLHAQPILTPDLIQKTIQAAVETDPDHFLRASDLADQIEQIRIIPESVSREELFKLWSFFFQTPYAISVAYKVSVVLLEAEGVVEKALPVKMPAIHTVPFEQPYIEHILHQEGQGKLIVLDSTIVIHGSRFSAKEVKVRIGSKELVPDAGDIKESTIKIKLAYPPFPYNSLRAGIYTVQVVHPTISDDAARYLGGVESNVKTFILHPVISQHADGITLSNVSKTGINHFSADIRIKVEPLIGKLQPVILMLNELTAEKKSASYIYKSLKRAQDSELITFSVSNINAGEYLVRLQVEGAESPLIVDDDPNRPTYNQYIGPKVVFT